MNKKLKKALYMFGFALPTVAIPIITVACGTQTSQNAPKEADKNQNEQTPKQETPIQDENKKVVVSSSLSSSKIYDENLLNSNVIELFKLFEEKHKISEIKNIIEKLSEKLDVLNITTSKEIKKLVNLLRMTNTKNSSLNNIVIELALKAEVALKAEEESAKPSVKEKLEEFVDDLDGEVKIEEEKTAEEALREIAGARKAEAIKEIIESHKIIDQSFNEISKNIINLYKKIFLIESSEGIYFSELKYNDFLSKFPEIKLFNFFNIENLKKHLQNLRNDNKLNEIRLKDIFNTNINSVIESLKKDQSENIKLLDFEKMNKKSEIIELLGKNNPELSKKIKDKLSNLSNFESFDSLLKELIFSDLFDIAKLQEKLNQ